MDNFRRYRSRSGYSSSTDGFIRTPRLRKSKQQPKRPKHGNAYRAEGSRIGDFRAEDGFHPVDLSARKIGRADGIGLQPRRTRKAPRGVTNAAESPKGRGASKRRWLALRGDREKPTSRWRRLKRLLIFNPLRVRNWTKQRAIAHAIVLVLVLGGLLGVRAWWLANKIFQGGGGAVAMQDDVDPSMLRGEGDGRVNILLLGRGGEGHEGADLTDTIVVASINPIQKEAALLSIPRDLYVQSSDGSYSKLNAVFANAKSNALASLSHSDSSREGKAEDAGFKAVEDVIKSKIGIPVHYHGIIDFAGFAKAIDTVGGVEVDVPESATVYEPGMWLMGRRYDLNVQRGRTHFNGIRALAYTRSRYTSERGDFDRSERQRLIIVALKDKIISAGTYGNPIKINQLMSDFGNHVRTNLSLNEVKRLHEIASEIPSSKISSVGLADPPNDYVVTGMVHGQSVVYPKAGLDNYREIQHFVRNRLIDGFLAHENATVAIYNGTQIDGLAGRTSDDLKSYGYNISTVADAPVKGAQKTIIVDLRSGNKKYTRRYLENRFSTTAVTQLPANSQIKPGDADFVIILGQNEQTRLAH